MYTDNLIKNFHGAYTRNVRRPKAYSQSLGLILDKIKKMVKPGSNQYKKAIETLKSIKGFDKITDYQSQILKDFKPIRQKAINIMMNIKKELSDLSKVDYNNKQNVNKHIDTLINLNKKLEPEVKEDYTKKEDKDIDELTAAQKKLPPALQKAIKKKEDAKEEVNEARWEIEGRVSYKNVGPEDSFHMVIDAPNEQAAEKRAYDELDKARQRRKIGPGGGGSIEDAEIEYIERTNDRFIIKNGKATVDNSNTADNKDHVHAPNAKIALQLHKQGKKVYKEDLVGGQKKLDKDKDGDLDAKDFSMLRKSKKEEVKEARWEIEGRVNYKGVGPEDGFHMVIDAPTESAAEDKAFDELVKARKQRKIGPGGGGGIDEMEIEYIEKTNDRLQPVTQQRLGNSYDPTQKEEVHPHVKKMVKDGESDEKIKKMHPKTTDKDLEKLKETHMSTAKAQNQKQKEVGGEKEPIKTSKNEWKTFAMMAAELRENNKADKGKKEQEAGEDTRDSKQKTMTGQTATSPEMNPRVDYKY